MDAGGKGGDLCVSCGRALPLESSSSCPDCLLRLGFEGSVGDVEIEGYEIIEALGEGGMGMVYLAEQQGAVVRMVAIKVIKVGMDTGALIDRFGGERQALAMMDHPNIANVYDAGATAAGRPFFSMEWVDGSPIDVFCDSQKLGVRERLEYFLEVCGAVQHAHSKGVVHCDLKPTNVLVAKSEEGWMPKVIDFGIARTIDPEAKYGQATAADGGGLSMLGTPAYMSPEQALETTQDVDTRADVYSLGAMLYELLAGSPAFSKEQLTSGGLQELLRVLRDEDPERPSVRAVAAGRTVPEDLDWIVRRAMEKNRDQRYPSAGQFADDIRRFLAFEPVVARPSSKRYQLAKFARRNRVALAAGGAIAMALAVAAGVSIAQAVRAHQAEKQAIENRERSELLVDFMLLDLYGSLKDLGRLDLLDGVAKAASEYYEDLPSDVSEKAIIGRSSALSKVSEIRSQQGDLEGALDVAEMALAVLGKPAASTDASSDLRFEYALRNSQVALAVRKIEGAAAALPYLNTAIDATLPLLEDAGERKPDYQGFLAGFYNILGTTHRLLGDHELALEKLSLSKALREELLASDPDDVIRRNDVAEIYVDLARAHAAAGDDEIGIGLLEGALELRRGIPGDRPGEVRWLSLLASTHYEAARHHRGLGEMDKALVETGKAIEIWRRVTDHDPENVDWRASMARSLQEQVGTAIRAGRHSEYVDVARETTALWTQLYELTGGEREQLESIRSQYQMGRVLLETGDMAVAERWLKEAQQALKEMEESSPSTDVERSVEVIKALIERVLLRF